MVPAQSPCRNGDGNSSIGQVDSQYPPRRSDRGTRLCTPTDTFNLPLTVRDEPQPWREGFYRLC
ncbi:MAG: hypothetical protein KatS3mg054_0833 [Chloroflexus sp.]|nr:MAG: hypothetical protein KatS3mg054_0833 [Chloroflexus sp.]GIV93449.1 MAG: hypothetical protein KatS3mg056_2158 [Chloroflexus sp.]